MRETKSVIEGEYDQKTIGRLFAESFIVRSVNQLNVQISKEDYMIIDATKPSDKNSNDKNKKSDSINNADGKINAEAKVDSKKDASSRAMPLKANANVSKPNKH